MYHLDIGLSAIRAAQIGLRTASNNLANAATDGYHRQQVIQADRNPITQGSLQLGSGVTVARIQRLVDSAVEAAILRNRSGQADATARLSILNRVDSTLGAGGTALANEVTKLFDSLEQLAAKPNDAVLQRQVVNAAQSVTGELNSTLSETQRLQQDVRQQAESAVREVSQLSSEIAKVNQQIQVQLAQGREPNDLLDRRDGLVAQLSGFLDLAPGGFSNDGSPLPGAGGTLLFGTFPVDLRVVVSDDGQLQLFAPNSEAPIVPSSGKLAGLLDAHNNTLTGLRDNLLDWFEGLRRSLDQVQATGLGASGGFTRLEASQSVLDANAPLASQGASLPIASGDLFVTMTNTSTGQRSTYRIAIDPQVDSLNDVAAKLSAIPGLGASVPAGTNRLVIAAGAGLTFDFAGRLDSQPTPTAVIGTATTQLGGLYTGARNANWQVVALDSGTVGVSSPLRLAIKDATTGATLRTLDVGQGYAADSTLELPDGVTLSLGSGSINAGDTWAVSPVAQPDETGLIGVLGLRSLFVGGAGGPFGVHADLVRDPGQLASSRSGLSGDSSNLERLIAVRELRLFGPAGETIESRLASLIANVGQDTQFTRGELDQLQTVGSQLSQDRDALSGVDPNEETLSLLRLQQSFQAATRFISVIQSTVDDLLKIVG